MAAQLGDEQADITQGEWDKHRGELVRTTGMVATLGVSLNRTNANLEITRNEMRGLRRDLSTFLTSVKQRLEKHSDWRETTAERERSELEKELEQLKGSNERRVALWVKIVFGVLAGLVEAGIVHWMHLK